MRFNTWLKLAVLGAALLFVAACSTIERQRVEREAARAEEKAGRVTMVLENSRLQADPELGGEIITFPPPRLLSDGWPQAGSRANKTSGHIAAGEKLEVIWQVDIGKGSSRDEALVAPPVANSDTVFTIDSVQTVSAFDAVTGIGRWKHKLKSDRRRDKTSIGAGLAVENGKLVVASGYGFVAALDVSTGKLVWRTDTQAPMTGSPTIDNGRVFVSSNNNEIIAFNLDDGAVLWSDQAIAESARILASTGPATVEDIVVVPYSSGEVIAYFAANGRRLWSEALTSPLRFTPISAINDIAARPVLGQGLVFVGNQSGVLAAIDGRTGNRVWQQFIGMTQAPALVGDYLFVLGINGDIACLMAQTGQVIWVRNLSRHGEAKSRKKPVSRVGPILASGRIIVISSQGILMTLDPQTGDEIDRLDLGDPVYIEPIAVQNRLIVLTDKARLVAIQ